MGLCSETVRKKTVLCSLLACTITILALAGCSTESRSRTIIYDEAWSNAAAVRNLSCVPEMQTSCEREAREGERNFSDKLPAAFQVAPECRTVQFLILAADASNAKDLENRLEKNVGSKYWRLRVDFHPRLSTQTFDLALGTDRPTIGGDDVGHNSAYICKAVKNNGVTAIW
jgi:uncharacterized lipoprotein YajG